MRFCCVSQVTLGGQSAFGFYNLFFWALIYFHVLGNPDQKFFCVISQSCF